MNYWQDRAKNLKKVSPFTKRIAEYCSKKMIVGEGIAQFTEDELSHHLFIEVEKLPIIFLFLQRVEFIQSVSFLQNNLVEISYDRSPVK